MGGDSEFISVFSWRWDRTCSAWELGEGLKWDELPHSHGSKSTAAGDVIAVVFKTIR